MEPSVECNGTLYFYYLITIKCNHKVYTSRMDIITVYSRLLRKLGTYELFDNKAWELDGDRRWHYHFMVALPRPPYYKGLGRKNWHIHFQEIPKDDIKNTIQYLRKINQNKYYLEQLDILSRVAYGNITFI